MRSGFTPVFTGDSSATTCKTQCIQMLSELRSTKIHRHKARAWAVATPLCAASQPPNASGAGGRYRPGCLCKFSSFVADRTVSKQPNRFESYIPNEDEGTALIPRVNPKQEKKVPLATHRRGRANNAPALVRLSSVGPTHE